MKAEFKQLAAMEKAEPKVKQPEVPFVSGTKYRFRFLTPVLQSAVISPIRFDLPLLADKRVVRRAKKWQVRDAGLVFVEVQGVEVAV